MARNNNSLFYVMFTVVLCFILLVWSLLIFIGYQAVSDPSGMARLAGNLIGEVLKGVEEKL